MSDPAPSEAALGPKWRDLALHGGRLAFGGVAFAAFLGLFARWSSFAEITTHFRVVYVWAAAVAVGLALLARRPGFTGLSAVALVWALADVAPWYVSAPRVDTGAGPSLRVMSANVDIRNDEYALFLNLIDAEEPDIVFVQETTPGWFAALKDRYAYRVEVPHRGYFGLGLYSKYPIENAQVDDPVNRDVPIVRADVIVEGRRVHVVNVHIPAPEHRELVEIREAQFAWLTEYLPTVSGPAIVAGDYNCTMWSPLYRRLAAKTRLSNARQGYGLLPTWFPIVGPLHLLPIDQIAGRGVVFSGTRLGTRVGSDHCPLVTDVALLE